MINLDHYQTIIFDCDGVILNSNFQKIEAYRNAALEFGASKEQAESLVQHHVALTGISRYVKFEYFLIICSAIFFDNVSIKSKDCVWTNNIESSTKSS